MSASIPEQPIPTRAGGAVFGLKRLLLSARHGLIAGEAKLSRGDRAAFPHLLTESRTPLFTALDERERPLELGKIQNLRTACRSLDGLLLPAGETFSFWRQVGRCTRSRGYVQGRELQGGCLVPAIGGGLCQLSNALYDLALRSGCEIVERHAHTSRVPNSPVPEGRDATVAWNYIDLRFCHATDVYLEARLTGTELVVAFRSAQSAPQPIAFSPTRPLRPLRSANSCATCETQDCHRNEKPRPTHTRHTAFLVDEFWPEFDAYLRQVATREDELLIPLDGRRWRKPQYAWDTSPFSNVRPATLTTLRRSIASRKLGSQGAARQKGLLKGAEELAASYARHLRHDASHVVVSLPLLPYLWRDGHLGGRTFDVLMTRFSLAEIHRLLDEALAASPDRKLLGDFRADPALLALEEEALRNASRLITPHRMVAKDDPRRLLLDWKLPAATTPRPGSAIAFPGPTVSRKGAYEVREAARTLDLEVVVIGSQIEGAAFWEGVRARPPSPEGWLDGVAAVVQPAVLEDKPRRLLHAIASGVPVITTEATGLAGMPGVSLIPVGDAEALKRALVP